MDDERISLAHGNGGRFMRELIEEVFARQLSASEIDVQADAVPIELGDADVMITTDGFTVQPLEFPGGDIGYLAVHGTTNDLAVAGARRISELARQRAGGARQDTRSGVRVHGGPAPRSGIPARAPRAVSPLPRNRRTR